MIEMLLDNLEPDEDRVITRVAWRCGATPGSAIRRRRSRHEKGARRERAAARSARQGGSTLNALKALAASMFDRDVLDRHGKDPQG